MNEQLAQRLILSIEGNRLVLFCGAGLSMAQPSRLPSAASLAERCWDRYREITGVELPDVLKNDLEAQALHFMQNGTFQNTFLTLLVPWGIFRSQHNMGHEAIADFLAAGILEYAVTPNFDPLIEDAILQLGGKDFRASIDSLEAPSGGSEPYRPLHKIHGCCVRNRDATLWCDDQLLSNPTIRSRIEGYQTWLRGRLGGSDVIMLGFWSDWAYLNTVLATCVNPIEPNSIVLVDPASPGELERKAPQLWTWAHSGNVRFEHVQEQGEQFLDELRMTINRNILRRLIEASLDAFQERTGRQFPNRVVMQDGLSSRDLYALRRNFAGKTKLQILRSKGHTVEHQNIGLCHLRLIERGAIISGPFYIFNGRRVRLIHAAGQIMSSVKSRFATEPPDPDPPDVNICVGADDDVAAPNIVRSETQPTLTRSGLLGEWVTHTFLDNIL